jgi:hypothetical protein
VCGKIIGVGQNKTNKGVIMKRLISMMPWKMQRFFYNRGWGMVPDDHPDAGPVSYEVFLPDDSRHIVTIDPDGRTYGLPGSPPHGLQGKEELDNWLEKMKALGKW